MLGNRIKLLREELGLKQEELANKMSVSPSSIGMYETNKREPNNELILKLAEYFGVSTDYLLGKTDLRKAEAINIDDADIAFYNGVKGLNDTNKAILKGIIEGLTAKQKEDEQNTHDKK